jgi:hypothetical protein
MKVTDEKALTDAMKLFERHEGELGRVICIILTQMLCGSDAPDLDAVAILRKQCCADTDIVRKAAMVVEQWMYCYQRIHGEQKLVGIR